MYGYGYPPFFPGYNDNYNNGANWAWAIVIVIVVIFFLFWGFGNSNNGCHN